MLKLGFVSAILADFSLDHVVRFAGNHGFSCVEVMCWPSGNADSRRYAGVTHIDVNDLSPKRISDIKYLLNETQVSISALGYYPNPLDPDLSRSEFYLEHIKDVIRGAQKLNIPVVNTFIGRDLPMFGRQSLKWPKNAM